MIAPHRLAPSALRLLLLLALGIAAACRTTVIPPPTVAATGSAVRIGPGLLTAGIPIADGVLFPAIDGAPQRLDRTTREVLPAATSARGAWSDAGGLLSLDLEKPSLYVDFQSRAADGRLMISTSPDQAPKPVSPAGERVTGFDLTANGTSTWVAWCAADSRGEVVRVAELRADGRREAARIVTDAGIPGAAHPTIAPIGLASENAVVVAYVAIPARGNHTEVRVARAARGSDGAIVVSATRSPGRRFAWMRAPHLSGRGGNGILVFEGALEGDEEDPAFFVVPMNDLGDPLGEPTALLQLYEGGVRRSRPTIIELGTEWWLAWEERRDQDPPVVFAMPIAVK